MKKVKPLHDQLLVKRHEAQEVSKGGIFIPGTSKEQPLEGEVLAVGKGRILENGSIVPLEVKVGDVVMFPPHSFIEIKIDNEEYLIIRETAALAVIEK